MTLRIGFPRIRYPWNPLPATPRAHTLQGQSPSCGRFASPGSVVSSARARVVHGGCSAKGDALVLGDVEVQVVGGVYGLAS